MQIWDGKSMWSILIQGVKDLFTCQVGFLSFHQFFSLSTETRITLEKLAQSIQSRIVENLVLYILYTKLEAQNVNIDNYLISNKN